MRQTVLKRTKEALLLKVSEKREASIAFVIILRETDGEPKRRFASSKERVIEREVVGEGK